MGEEVRRRRKALDLTLEQLAERAALTPQYIGTIENGRRDPSLTTLAKIARGLGVSVGVLLGGRPKLSPSGREMARLYDTVSAEIRDAILLILRGTPPL